MVNTTASLSVAGAFGGEVIGTTVGGPARFNAAVAGGAPAGTAGNSTTVNRSNLVWNSSFEPVGSWSGATTFGGGASIGGAGPNNANLAGDCNWVLTNCAVTNSTAGFGGSKYGLKFDSTSDTAEHAAILIDGQGSIGNYGFKQETVNIHVFIDYDVYANAATSKFTLDVMLGTTQGGTEIFKGQLIHDGSNNQLAYPQDVTFGGVAGKQGLDATSPCAGLTLNGTTQGTYHLSFPFDTSGIADSSSTKLYIKLTPSTLTNSGEMLVKNVEFYVPNWISGSSATVVGDLIYSGEAGRLTSITTTMQGDAQNTTDTSHVATTYDFSYNKSALGAITTDGHQDDFTGTTNPFYIYDGFSEGRYPIYAKAYIANLNDANGTFREFNDKVDDIDIISVNLVLKAFRTKADAIADTNEITPLKTGQVCTSNQAVNTEGFHIFEKYYFRIESSEPSIEFYIDWDDGEDNSREKANSEVIKLEEPSFFAVTSHVFTQHKKHHPVLRCKSLDGFFSKYYTAWEDLGTYKTTTTSALTSSATALPVAARDGIANGSYLRMGGEYLLVGSGGGATGAGTLTVSRGALDSLAIYHATGEEVYLATGENQNDYSGLETDSLSAGQNDTSLVSLDSMKIHRIPTFTPANKPPIALLKADKNKITTGINKFTVEQTPFTDGEELSMYFMKAELAKYGTYTGDPSTWSWENSPAIKVTYLEKDPMVIRHEEIVDDDDTENQYQLHKNQGIKQITLYDGDYIVEPITTTTAELPKVADADGHYNLDDINYYYSHKSSSGDNYVDGGDFNGDQRTVLTVAERKNIKADTVYEIKDSDGRKEYIITTRAGTSRFAEAGYTGAGSVPIERLNGYGYSPLTNTKGAGQYIGYLTASIDNNTSTLTLPLSERKGIQANDILWLSTGGIGNGEAVTVSSSYSNATGPGNVTLTSRNAGQDEDGTHGWRVQYQSYNDIIENWNIGTAVWRAASTFESGSTISRVIPVGDILKVELVDVRENSGLEANKLGKNDRMRLTRPQALHSNDRYYGGYERYLADAAVVSTGNPIIEKNDPERTVNFDFSESYARSPNSNIANYYFDKGHAETAHGDNASLDSLASQTTVGDNTRMHISRVLDDALEVNESNYSGWSVQYALETQPMDEDYRFLPKEYLTKLQVRDDSATYQSGERFDGFEYSYLYHSEPFHYYYFNDTTATQKYARPESLRKWEIFCSGAYNNAEITDSGGSTVVVHDNGTLDAFTWNGGGVAGNFIYGAADRGGTSYPNSPLRFSDTSDFDASIDSTTNPSGEGVNERASYWFLVARPDKFDRIFFNQSDYMAAYQINSRGKFNSGTYVNQPPTFRDALTVASSYESADAAGTRYLTKYDNPQIRIQMYYSADPIAGKGGTSPEGNVLGKGWKPLKFTDTTNHPEHENSSFCKSGSLTWIPPTDWIATTAAEINAQGNFDVREGMYADDTTDGPRTWVNSGYGILIGVSYSAAHPAFWDPYTGVQDENYQQTASGKNETSWQIAFNDAFVYNDPSMQLITVEDPHHVSLNDIPFTQSISYTRNGIYHTVDNRLGIATSERIGSKSGTVKLGGVDLNDTYRDSIKKYQAKGTPVYFDLTHKSGNSTRFFGVITSMSEDSPAGKGHPKYGIQLQCNKILEFDSSGAISSDGYISLGGEKGDVAKY